VLSAGGKGVNVARAVHCLGENGCCVGILGGHTGRLHAELVAQEGFTGFWTWIDQETRAAVIVNDPVCGEMTVINENGPQLTRQEWECYTFQVLELAAEANAVCFCGSLPLGVPPDKAYDLLTAVQKKGCRIWIDTSGKTLQAAIQAQPAVVKINLEELSEFLGVPTVREADQIARLAKKVLGGGIEQVVVTLGKDGAILVTNYAAWVARPPELSIVSPIGSGDSFLAGLVTATLSGLPAPETLCRAVAAGTANALTIGAGKLTGLDYEKILLQVYLEKIEVV